MADPAPAPTAGPASRPDPVSGATGHAEVGGGPAGEPGAGPSAVGPPPAVEDLPRGMAGWIPYPTRRLVLLFVLGAVAMVVAGSGWALVVVDTALVLAALVDWAAAPDPRTVVVHRRVPEVVTLDQPARIEWILRNTTGRRLRVAFADALAPSLRAGDRRARVVLPPEGWAEASTLLRPSRRGRFLVERLTVRVTGPLGLAARQRDRSQRTALRVYPPFRSRQEAELRINRSKVVEVGLRTAQGRGGGTEFDQLREYTVDDEFRRIDWAATARAGRAIVRTYRPERNQTVLCLLDNGRMMAGRVDDVPRVEHAMDAVMMLTAVASRLGDRAGLVAFDSTVRSVVAPAHGRDQLNRVTEAMFDLEPQLAESDYRAAFTAALARFRRRAMLVILTDLVEQATAEHLEPALPLIVRNHLVVVGAVRDPDVVRWATAPPTDAQDSYRKAAAVLALEERRRTVARLRGLGATVIDAPPGRLAPDLADAYLRVKAVGRL